MAVHYNGRSDFVVGFCRKIWEWKKGFKVGPTIEGVGGGERGEIFAIKNTCRDMRCGTGYCFYPGNKGNRIYSGGRVENVGRCLEKKKMNAVQGVDL